MSHNFYNETILPLLTSNPTTVVEFFMHSGLLPRYKQCECCEISMKLVVYSRNNDKVAWRCLNVSCGEYKKYKSIRKGSFFEKFKLPLNILLNVMWKWLNDHTQISIQNELSLGNNFLNCFFGELRKKCENYFSINHVQLGGNGIICQVDESLFRHKPKYHRGRATNNELWVFGIADCSYKPSRVYLQLVENRTSNVLMPIIYSVCRPGTVIYSDQWRAYRNFSEINMEHYSVNHSLYFIDPNTSVHTQNIESYWSKAKLRVKQMKGVRGSHLKSYLAEWMFKDWMENKDFNKLIELIKNY